MLVKIKEEHIEIIEKEVRCVSCDKLLSKMFIYLSMPKNENVNATAIQSFHPDIEMKVCIETKCNRCKNMDYKITVI